MLLAQIVGLERFVSEGPAPEGKKKKKGTCGKKKKEKWKRGSERFEIFGKIVILTILDSTTPKFVKKSHFRKMQFSGKKIFFDHFGENLSSSFYNPQEVKPDFFSTRDPVHSPKSLGEFS